jgi:hypothetical protein
MSGYHINIGMTGTATYCDFDRLGNTGATEYAFWSIPHEVGKYPSSLVMTNCRFRSCGALYIKPARVGTTVTFEDNEVTDNLAPAISMVLTDQETGNFTIKRNVFHNSRRIAWDACDIWTVENNYFHEVPSTVHGSGFASFKNNFCRDLDGNTGQLRGPTIEDNYFCHDVAEPNFGVMVLKATETDLVFSGNICDSTSTSQAEQADYIGSDSTGGYTVTIQNNIMLPLAFGICCGKMYSDYQSLAASKVQLFHNTCVATSHDDPGNEIETGFGFGENAASRLAEVCTGIKSNLFWAPTGISGGFMVARHVGATTQDMVLAANVTDNWGYGLSPGSEEPALGIDGFHCGDTATAMFSSGTPTVAGTTDPLFVDTTRNLATFDTASLGNAVATAWATSTAYVVGDVVSNTDADFYDSTPVNFRCISDHTSGASTEPGAGADWWDEWELQSNYRLREDLTRIPDLVAWVKAGFAVQNPALKNAGHDGATIGAGVYSALPAPAAPGQDVMTFAVAGRPVRYGAVTTCNKFGAYGRVDAEETPVQPPAVAEKYTDRFDNPTYYPE